MQEKAKQVAELLKLLANENRLLLLCALLERPMTVGELAAFTPNISLSALSQHLHTLRTAGLVGDAKKGQHVTYSITDPRLAPLIAVLKEHYCAE